MAVARSQVERFYGDHSWAALLNRAGIGNVLPGAVESSDLPGAVLFYRAMCNRSGVSYGELESTHGVVAITLEPL